MEEQNIPINYKGVSLEVSVSLKRRSEKWFVCFHGIQSNKELFEDLLKQPFLENYSLLAIDFIGFGKSSKPVNFSYDIQDQANIMEKVVRNFEINEMNLIGHSLGGMVGTLLLKPLKNVIKSFINAEGNLVFADCGASRIVAEQSFEEFKNAGYEELKLSVKSSNEPSSKKRSKWLEEIPDFVFYKTSVSIVECSQSEKLLKILKESLVRKLFMFGDKNRQKAAILPENVRQAKIPNSGHFMLIDNPKAVFETFEEFLKRTN